MALGVSWMDWRRPVAPHGQQRPGYNGRTSERSRDVLVGRVSFEVPGDEKLGLRRSRCLRGIADGLGCAKGLRRPRCGCSGGPTSRHGGFSPINQPTTWHQFAWPVSVTRNMPCLGALRAVLVGDVNFLKFLFFCQDFHRKTSALLSSAGLFVFLS